MASVYAYQRRSIQEAHKAVDADPMGSRYPSMATKTGHTRSREWPEFQRRYINNPTLVKLKEGEECCPSCTKKFDYTCVVPIRLPCHDKHAICRECAKGHFSTYQSDGHVQNTCLVCKQAVFLAYNHYQTAVEHEVQNWETEGQLWRRIREAQNVALKG